MSLHLSEHCMIPRQRDTYGKVCVCVLTVVAVGGGGGRAKRGRERETEGEREVVGGVCLFLLCFFDVNCAS